jgi:hypothetical protein
MVEIYLGKVNFGIVASGRINFISKNLTSEVILDIMSEEMLSEINITTELHFGPILIVSLHKCVYKVNAT